MTKYYKNNLDFAYSSVELIPLETFSWNNIYYIYKCGQYPTSLNFRRWWNIKLSQKRNILNRIRKVEVKCDRNVIQISIYMDVRSVYFFAHSIELIMNHLIASTFVVVLAKVTVIHFSIPNYFDFLWHVKFKYTSKIRIKKTNS